MPKVILLDAGPLGMISHPRVERNREIAEWVIKMLQSGHRILVPEIVDYEVRRELLRADKTEGIRRLDFLKKELGFLPITSEAMLRAAKLWAMARRAGKPSAADTELDVDVILAAQATTVQAGSNDVIIATANVKHLKLFAKARMWTAIE